jgi:transposase
VPFKRIRWLLPKNSWNLSDDQKERLSTLVRWNTPIMRAHRLKEAFQLFWDYQQPKRAWASRRYERGWRGERNRCASRPE